MGRRAMRHLPSPCGFGMAGRRVAIDASQNIAKNFSFPICNLQRPTPTSSGARDFIGVANCRLLIEMMTMIGEEEARSRILDKIGLLPERTVPLANALGCFAARDYFGWNFCR